MFIIQIYKRNTEIRGDEINKLYKCNFKRQHNATMHLYSTQITLNGKRFSGISATKAMYRRLHQHIPSSRQVTFRGPTKAKPCCCMLMHSHWRHSSRSCVCGGVAMEAGPTRDWAEGMGKTIIIIVSG